MQNISWICVSRVYKLLCTFRCSLLRLATSAIGKVPDQIAAALSWLMMLAKRIALPRKQFVDGENPFIDTNGLDISLNSACWA